MPEQFSQPSAEKYLEVIESRAYTELLQAQERVDSLMQEIKKVFTQTPDIREAERIILETYASQLSVAQNDASRALEDWVDSIREQHELLSSDRP